MNHKENILGQQVKQWSMLGPFIMMLVLSALIINPLHQPLYIPLISLIGILLCWKWKIRGLTVALGCLGCVFLYQLWVSPTEKIFWNLMVAVATALTFTITALSGQEVEEILEEAQKESDDHRHNFLTLNEKIQKNENEKEEELKAIVAKNLFLEKALSQENFLLQTSQKASSEMQERLSTLQEKMVSISNQNDSLLRELFQKRHECEKLSQQLADFQQKTEEDHKKEVGALQELISQLMTSSHEKQQDAPKEAPTNKLANNQVGKSTSKSDKKSPPIKSKTGKPTKTNNWANAIMSRWSEK